MSKTSGEASLNSEGRQVVDDFYSESDRCESPNKFKHIMDDEEQKTGERVVELDDYSSNGGEHTSRD